MPEVAFGGCLDNRWIWSLQHQHPSPHGLESNLLTTIVLMRLFSGNDISLYLGATGDLFPSTTTSL